MGCDSKSSYDAAGTVLNLDEPPRVNSINHGGHGLVAADIRIVSTTPAAYIDPLQPYQSTDVERTGQIDPTAMK